jgi:hypothetical protein
MMLALLWPAVVAGCMQPCSGSRTTIYVDAVHGRDEPADGASAASGCSADRPLRTLGAAQAAARRVLRDPEARGVTVSAAAGVYAPLALTAEDSGTGGEGGLRYEGAPGAVISGGVALPPGSPVAPGDPVFGRLPTATRTHARRFDVGELIGPSPSEIVSGAVQLVCDGRALELAAWPSNGSWAHTGTAVGRDGFTFPPDAPIPVDADGLWLEGYFVYDWSDSRIPVMSVDAANHTLFATPSGYVERLGHFNPGARFRFLNLPELLLRPGQFWLDNSSGRAALYATFAGGSGAAGAGCTLAVAPTVLNISDASHLSVTGFTIEFAQETIVKVTNSNYIGISNCTVRTGLSGVEVAGGGHVTVSDVEATSLGGTAISINGGDRARLLPGSHSVTNCTIHDYARVLWCYHPGVLVHGVGNTVTHNEIFQAPHQGILVGGNDHRIAFNVFHDLLLESFDSGAIYKSDRDWTARGLVMDSNFFYDLGSTSPTDRCNPHTACCRHGIYMDATEHGFTATRNLIVQPPELRSSACNYGVFDNGGRNNVISSNLCVGYPTCVRIADYNLISTPEFSEGMVRNFAAFRYRSPPYSHYSGLADLDSNVSLPLKTNCSKREKCGAAPWHVSVTSNVVVDGAVKLIPYGGEISPVPALPRFNFSHNANVSMAAMGFESAHPTLDNCWGIKPESPIFAAARGFEQIELGMVGPPAFRAAYAERCGQAQ